MNKNSPLDFLLLENSRHDSLFGDSDVNEVTLPDNMESLGSYEDGADEAEEGPEHEAGESEDTESTEESLSTLSEELNKIKDTISGLKSKYPEDVNNEIAKALDDATSAIDLAVHHLGDIGEDLDALGEEPQELEDGQEPVKFSGSASPEVAGAMFDAGEKADNEL